MKKRRLVHVITGLARGGAEQVLIDLMNGLGNNHFEHIVIYFRDGPHKKSLEHANIKHYHVQGKFFLYDPFFMQRLWHLLRVLQPDCIHAVLWSAIVICRVIAWLQGIPTVTAIHSLMTGHGALRLYADALTAPLSSHIIAVSESVESSIKQHALFLEPSAITVIRNGINMPTTRRLQQQPAVYEEQLKAQLNECYVIGSVGRFHPIKRYDYLLRVATPLLQQYTNIRLMLVGGGNQEYSLKKLTQELGIADKVLFIVNQPAHAYYKFFDCFVQPSAQEGISLALLEALTCSLPAVVTVPDNKHPIITHGKQGLLIPLHDQQQLSDALQFFYVNKTKAQEYGAAGYATIEQSWNSETMVCAYRTVFNAFAQTKELS